MAKREPEPDDQDETREDRAARRRRAESDARFVRAKEWAARQNLLRIEVESPSGRLVTYADPAVYLEAFATDEVLRAERDRQKRS